MVREGVWVENADFGITLVHLRLVERSILVYGKWGQFGHLEGARGGHVVCLNPLIWRLLKAPPGPELGRAHCPCPRAQSCAACCTWRRARMRLSLFPSLCLRPAPPHLEPAPPLLQTAGGRSPLPDPPPRTPRSCLDPAPSRLDLPKPPRPKLGCRFFSTPVPTCYVDRRSFAPICDACGSKTNDRDRSVGPFCRA